MSKKIAIVVSHTHWDREWYLPFDRFRRRLIKALDRLMVILRKDSAYRFLLDGQVVALEDYFERRPRNRATMAKFIEEGRVRIGPWYVMPDLFLVSPDSLYRNLRMGIETAGRLGGLCKVAYLPDPFGHPSQTWQLFRGFGIGHAVLWRGLPWSPESMQAEVWLESPDGSRLLAGFLPHGYTNARAAGRGGRLRTFLGRSLFSLVRTFTYPGKDPSALRDRGLSWLYRLAPFGVTHSIDAIEDWALGPRALERQAEALESFCDSGVLLLMNGGDHTPPKKTLMREVERANGREGGVFFQQGTLEEYFSALESRHKKTWPVMKGELRSGRFSPVLPGVLSSRVHLKIRNREIEDLLERWAYPMASLAALAKRKSYPKKTLDSATKLLLQNHPHDSICATSVDRVEKDMEGRFQRAEVLAHEALQESLMALLDEEGWLVAETKANAWAIFNPSCFERSEVVKDSNGPYGLSHDVPGLGFRLFPNQEGPKGEEGQPLADLKAKTLENEHLLVSFGNEGVSLRHKASGRVFEPLGLFEDSADAGDSYNFSPIPHDVLLMNPWQDAQPEVVENGPFLGRFRLRGNLSIPKRLNFTARRRVLKSTIPVVMELTLKKGSPYLEFRLNLRNAAKDHRLRVMLPTDVKTNKSFSDSAFSIEYRSLHSEPEMERSSLKNSGRTYNILAGVESPQACHPMRRFLGIEDEHGGIAVFNRGLYEYEAIPNDGGTLIALTLVRSTGWLSRSSLRTRKALAGPPLQAPVGQCLRELQFEMALYPYAGSHKEAELVRVSETFSLPLRVLPLSSSLPRDSSRGFLTIEPATVQLFGVELSQGGFLVRFGNMDEDAQRCRLISPFFEEALEVDFLERPKRSHKFQDNLLRLDLKPFEIVMMLLKPYGRVDPRKDMG